MHVDVVGTHACPLAQSSVLTQFAHAPVRRSQRGFSARQWALVRHSTQRPISRSQRVRLASSVQCSLSRHSMQSCRRRSQTKPADGQGSSSSLHVSRQPWVVSSHRWLALQSPVSRHSTHTLRAGSQCAPPQSLSPRQATHRPDASSQRRPGKSQSASSLHCVDEASAEASSPSPPSCGIASTSNRNVPLQEHAIKMGAATMATRRFTRPRPRSLRPPNGRSRSDTA